MKKLKLSALAITFIFVSSVILTLIICSVWGVFLNNLSNEMPQFFNKEIHVKREARMEKEQVQDAISLINSIKANSYKDLKNTLKYRDIMAWKLAYSIYNKYKGKLTSQEIKQRILDALSYQVLDRGKGYCFIVTLNGVEILGPQKNLIGKDLLKNKKFSKSVEQEIDVVKRHGEGFVYGEFLYKGKYEKRMAYVKLFKPFNWYIGSGKLITMFEKEIMQRTLNTLSSSFKHFKNPNLFVIQMNLNNKQCQGRVIFYTDPYFKGHTCIELHSKFITDMNGKPCAKECVYKLKKKGELLTHLIWTAREKGTRKRIVYLKLYKPYNWILGSGAPENFESIFPNFSNYLKKRFLRYVTTVFLISLITSIILGLLLWFLFFTKLLYKPLKKDIDNIKDFFSNYPKKKRIDTNKTKISEIHDISISINGLLESIENKNSEIKALLDKYSSLAKNIPDTLIIFAEENGKFILEDTNKKHIDIPPYMDLTIGNDAEQIFTSLPSIIKAIKMVHEKSISTQFYTIIEKYSKSYVLIKMYKVGEQYVACLIRNVTENVKAFKSLEKNRDFMKNILNNIKTGIVIINSKGIPIFVNSFAKAMLDIHEAKDILDKIKLSNNIKYKLLKVLHGREICEGCEVKITTATGLSKWFNIYATEINNKEGKMIIISFNNITQKYLRNKQLEYLSFHDSLTGLYNRRYFEEEFHRMFNKRNLPLGLVIADINGLKIVNDILGHKIGDELIMKTAEILSISTRASDIVARIGGDEFAIMLPNTSIKGAKKLISRIMAKLEEYNLRNELFISVSWGYVIHKGQFNNTEELFKAADNELYRNKYSESRRTILLKIAKWASTYMPTTRKIDEKYIIEREEITPPPRLK